MIGLVWFGFFVEWHIILRGLFDAQTILVEQLWYYSCEWVGDKGVHTIPADINLNVNLIAQRKFEPTYDDVTV